MLSVISVVLVAASTVPDIYAACSIPDFAAGESTIRKAMDKETGRIGCLMGARSNGSGTQCYVEPYDLFDPTIGSGGYWLPVKDIEFLDGYCR